MPQSLNAPPATCLTCANRKPGVTANFCHASNLGLSHPEPIFYAILKCGDERLGYVREAPAGYTEEELERDNPYNAWMYEK